MHETAPEADRPAAVVVGACSHGLAIARSLCREQVAVHLLECNTSLPGTHTAAAVLHRVPAIHGEALIRTLTGLATSGVFGPGAPVLFLTNDRMVGDVALHWEQLSPYFRLSWADSRADILRLLQKAEHEVASNRAGCAYPASRAIETVETAEEAVSGLPFPLIVKPSRPLSSFKVRIVGSEAELAALCRAHHDALPFLAQPFVPGGDDRIRFTAFYLQHGEPLAVFEGRKLQSRPMGHTTIAEPFADCVALDHALRFFRANRISGPASLEVKLDEHGRPWVIEPTVGRTDFWLQLCVSNGVNLPWIEYGAATGARPHAPLQSDRHCWLNTDRDRLAMLRYAGMVASGKARLRRPVSSFFSPRDLEPWIHATKRNNMDRLARLRRRLLGLTARAQPN